MNASTSGNGTSSNTNVSEVSHQNVLVGALVAVVGNLFISLSFQVIATNP
jgi:hypothetical protein